MPKLFRWKMSRFSSYIAYRLLKVFFILLYITGYSNMQVFFVYDPKLC